MPKRVLVPTSRDPETYMSRVLGKTIVRLVQGGREGGEEDGKSKERE